MLIRTSKTEGKHSGYMQPPLIFFYSYVKHNTFDFEIRIGYVKKTLIVITVLTFTH